VEQILADKIDILIDLSGHSAGNRLKVFARKPAPVQVTAWGHATGTGIPTIDYLFADPVTIPRDVRRLFAEQMYDLPCSITAQSSPDGVRAVLPPILSRGSVSFGVFNRASKISDEAISVWARILRAVPGSRLLFKDGAFEDASLQLIFTEKFLAQDIESDRLVFLGRTPRLEHLAAFGDVDICLDPFPQNGGVSTWEALQMGVPVVAVLGNGPANRVSASILTSIGLRDLVAESHDSYVAIASRLAANLDQLKTLREDLPGRISSAAAGNCATYTRAVEEGYRAMWRAYCLDGEVRLTAGLF
jgi:predicted O-linked N-acetylglucosamine transferase (SPINDLY family)